MILTIFKFVFVLFYFKSVHSFNFKNENHNLLENNLDLIEEKNLIPQYDEDFEFEVSDNKPQLIVKNRTFGIEKAFNSEHFGTNLTVYHFILFTRDFHNGKKWETLKPFNVSAIKRTHIKARSTFILIHGFSGHGLENWILNIKDKLLEKEDCNVLSIDWPSGDKLVPQTYLRARENVPLVGNDIAFVIETLRNLIGLSLESIHCIGHSLGAHVCGFTGKPFMGKMGRISGLDPAGLYYHNLNSSSRLDKTDAAYVDVIHTNACSPSTYLKCYGLNENIGHSNFYPNGGVHQTGCWLTRKDLSAPYYFACSHRMVYLYYLDSLNYTRSSKYFLARPCENWAQYQRGKCPCGNSPQFMGFNVNTQLNGTFYLETNAYKPYGVQDKECFLLKGSNNILISNYIFFIEAIVFIIVITICVFMIIKWACCRRKRKEKYYFKNNMKGFENKLYPLEEERVLKI